MKTINEKDLELLQRFDFDYDWCWESDNWDWIRWDALIQLLK